MPLRTAVLVAGQRTAFVGHFGPLINVDAIGLGSSAVGGLLKKTQLDPNHVDSLIWGNVVLQTNAPNLAREIVIDMNLPKKIPAHMTSMACSSGANAVFQASTFIEAGHYDAIIAGGSDSMSHPEIPLPRPLTKGLGTAQKKARAGPIAAWKQLTKMAGYPSAKWLPVPPSVAERSTGKTMGWHADLMAMLQGVPRAEQEAYAIESHKKAAAAQKKGILAEEITPTPSGDKEGTIVTEDNLIRVMRADDIASKKPAFRKAQDGGTITAPTSSALTDGGSAMLVMSAAKARELGYPADVRIKSWSLCAIDPMPNLLLAPTIGIADCLQQAGLKLSDIDHFEIHEAFAAQVLATLRAINNKKFCDEYMAGIAPLGTVPFEKLNPNGGSLAIGHPFAATGGRVLTSAMNHMRRAGLQHGMVSICAAGGLGSVCILEHKPGGWVQ
eukprot:TRINITY_DN12323_c0_g1_i1.p1 TRINITY_DN12323_c0_g1~~TRINITY_DN12323_c0_g1_i1.p1  ORF type:complete len:441 (-),score=124.50 TRINITY_DN12323_c0_g1_i1:214-1536(-)